MSFFQKTHIFYLLTIFAISVFFSGIANANTNSIVQNVVKIKTYESVGDSYIYRSFGSAVAISPTKILTNAHVIVGANGTPTGRYEICFSDTFEQSPLCRDSARLIAYDTVADLALLELRQYRLSSPFSFSTKKIQLGSYVSMYGYPVIGGNTITRTDGKIAGYDQFMYKIDGNIDHGNSGGGAFDGSGFLIGIPTAVAADNASLGYMIPVKRIYEFLARKTPNYQIYTHSFDVGFSRFLTGIQRYHENMLVFRWKDIVLRVPKALDFRLTSSMQDPNQSVLNLTFSDMYDRVQFTFACTDDAGGLPGWQVRRDGFLSEQKLYPNWQMSAIDEKNFFTVFASRSGKPSTVTLYYKKYDSCYAEIVYKDINDQKIRDAILGSLRDNVSFLHDYYLKNFQKTPFFSLKGGGDMIRVMRSIDTLGEITTTLGMIVGGMGDWVHANIDHGEYQTLDELSQELGIDFSKITSDETYTSAMIDIGIQKSEIYPIVLSDSKRGVLVIHPNTSKKLINITFQYLYQTDSGAYGYWSWSGNAPDDTHIDTEKIKSIFWGLSGFPGKPWF